MQRRAARLEILARGAVRRIEQGGELGFGAFKDVARALDMLAHAGGEAFGGIGQRRVERAALGGQRLFEPPADIREPRRQALMFAADGLRQPLAERLDALDDAGAVRVEIARQRAADDIEFVLDLADARGEALRYVVRGRADLSRGVVAGCASAAARRSA